MLCYQTCVCINKCYTVSILSQIVIILCFVLKFIKCYSLMTGILTSHCKMSPLHRMVSAPSKGCSVL